VLILEIKRGVVVNWLSPKLDCCAISYRERAAYRKATGFVSLQYLVQARLSVGLREHLESKGQKIREIF
jgi:hypothetical protein